MINIKNKNSIQKMEKAGRLLADAFDVILSYVHPGVTTLELDTRIEQELRKRDLLTRSKGYKGYTHASCISINDEVVHGVPSSKKILKIGDVVSIDVCASFKGYCADMARTLIVGGNDDVLMGFINAARVALDKGIAQAKSGNHLSDISAAIQHEVERHGFNVVRDFAGHGIGKKMHEDPEILNYGEPGKGPVLRPGMTFALEPMITMGSYEVYVADDGWTVKTVDKSYAAHVEDTIVITEDEPKILTRSSCS